MHTLLLYLVICVMLFFAALAILANLKEALEAELEQVLYSEMK